MSKEKPALKIGDRLTPETAKMLKVGDRVKWRVNKTVGTFTIWEIVQEGIKVGSGMFIWPIFKREDVTFAGHAKTKAKAVGVKSDYRAAQNIVGIVLDASKEGRPYFETVEKVQRILNRSGK